ncbi:pilus assembly protein PilS [Neisseria meningitidis]|uniref:Pilus assembly protein PilS n=1 Tax=Neisseria meningitidis TaxID=487 RepID=A0A425AQ45_NEIME|nr:pilus assembly protein PilS [Neisseria meningitidis]AVH82588.1 pilus assembly protein PilS [Neisseria meningitidis]AVH83235.1 pilus assembly protein PilS [Neisseria meningitidis]MBG8579695.1 pilus assembly protein PilS [Neisseria meningitidis]MBG8583458.1 pilus assembly protein PilS [Neisseria meningitidis]
MKLKKLDSHFRGNDEVEVTRNLKQAKPNEPDSHFRGNDGMQVSVWMDSSFPRRRESRSVSAETYQVKRFLEILRPGFPLSWE